jgi:hypothetical protein
MSHSSMNHGFVLRAAVGIIRQMEADQSTVVAEPKAEERRLHEECNTRSQ